MRRQNLGELEMLVLLAVARLGEDRAYAVSIVDEIRERTGRCAQRSTVYLTLQRLEGKGLVSSRLGDPRPERGGKARRLIRLETPGLEALRNGRRALLNMWSGLEPTLETGR